MIYFKANVTTTAAPPMYPQDQQHQQQQHQQHQQQQQQQQQQHHQQQQQHDQQQHQPQSNQPQIHLEEYEHEAGSVLSKFTDHDLQVLKQLLVTGEKNKWKQITKDINTHALMRRNGVTDVNDLPPDSQVSSPTDESFNGGRGDGNGNSKNVSPTFVIKQYQSLLGLPNNQLYFGSLGSSLPYVVAERGWDDIQENDKGAQP